MYAAATLAAVLAAFVQPRRWHHQRRNTLHKQHLGFVHIQTQSINQWDDRSGSTQPRDCAAIGTQRRCGCLAAAPSPYWATDGSPWFAKMLTLVIWCWPNRVNMDVSPVRCDAPGNTRLT